MQPGGPGGRAPPPRLPEALGGRAPLPRLPEAFGGRAPLPRLSEALGGQAPTPRLSEALGGRALSPPPFSILTFSTLFPHAAAPNHGVFVENRLRHLLTHASGAVSATVLAPVPWFPSQNSRFGAWAGHAAAPQAENRAGIAVAHPRYLVLPRIGMSIAPWLLYASAARALAAMIRAGNTPDLIDAHYLYPDGVAAVWLGRRFGIPVVLTARGSDVTQLPDHAVPRALIVRACQGAAALITVSRGLRDALVRLGVAPDKITVLRNGVDLSMFTPQDQVACRRALGLSGPTLVSVGALIPRKGHDLTIAALAHLPGWTLVIAGEGPARDALQTLAVRLGVADRVRLPGAMPHADLPRLYGAAGISVLSSAREGWANVLLESMACGTPVVASPIAGNDEVVQGGASGLIAAARTPEAIAAAITTLAAHPPARADTAAYAARFGWDETSAGQMAVFRSALASRAFVAA
jgi:teichuronic acid biosynthesis glycosyltransferase TuaC